MANGFGGWIAAHPGTVGVVGEFAVPTNHHIGTVIPADGTAWANLLEIYYQRLQQLGISSIQWVASEVSVGENQTYCSPAYGQALNERMPSAIPLENHADDPGVRRGIALTGLEFGTFGNFSNANPGTLHSTYYAANQGSWNYLASRGVNFARIGFRWERLQPALGGALNATYLQAIQDQVTRAGTAGVDVVLDLHNYGRYITTAGEQTLGSAQLTSAHFNDVWRRLALVFAPQTRVVGYEIMNEPHDLPGGTAFWQTASQGCANAIRAVDSSTPIYVAGYNWSHVQNWATTHPTPWITGSNIAYVAHHYWDSESSGNVGGPAKDSVYDQTYASCVADAAAAGF